MTRRAYGYRRSPPDARDKIADPSGLTILPDVDLRKGPMPMVFDQGQLGSCTANAVAACLQYDLSLDRNLLGQGSARRRSRLDIYWGERWLENELSQGDTGAYGRDGFKYAQQVGVVLESVWPYDIATYETPPTTPAKRHKLEKPYAVVQQDADHIRAVLSNKQMIAFGFEVYSSFEDDPDLTSGIVPMPSGQRVGGHEMDVVGYTQDYPDHVIIRNSWSSHWGGGAAGAGGYALFPLAYLTDTSLASDLRTIVRSA